MFELIHITYKKLFSNLFFHTLNIQQWPKLIFINVSKKNWKETDQTQTLLLGKVKQKLMLTMMLCKDTLNRNLPRDDL